MARFHFEVVDGQTIGDPYGIELPTVREAEKVASALAQQIAVDLEDPDLKEVRVVSPKGEVVHRELIPIASSKKDD